MESLEYSLSEFSHPEFSLFTEAIMLFKHSTIAKVTKYLYLSVYISFFLQINCVSLYYILTYVESFLWCVWHTADTN